MSATAKEPQKPYLPAMGHDRLLPLYDPLQRLLGLGSVHRWLVDQARIQPDQRVLEIGCGTGNLAILIKRLHPGTQVIGIDPDPKALARAQRKAGREALSVQLDRGFAEELPYPDASFDRVLSALMFHHLGPKEQEESLGEVRRVLKPGGSLHLLDFGGAKVHSDGFIARLHHRSEHLRINYGDRIPTLMREAGFADPTEVAHRVTIAGRLTCYRASSPQRCQHQPLQGKKVTMNKPQSSSTAPSLPTAGALMKGPERPNAKDAFFKLGTGIHRAIFHASKGRIFGRAFGMPVAELVTTGRRSGKKRSTMLAVPISDGDRLVLVASFGGDDRNPAWYLNLESNPEVKVTIADSTRFMIARIATEAERAKLWPRITSVFEGYARYQERTDRPIPVVILEPG